MKEQGSGSEVYIYKQDPIREPSWENMARSSYEVLKALTPPLKKRLVIKPNITVPSDPDSGIVTHPGFVSGIVDYFLDRGMSPDDIKIAEGCGGEPPGSTDKHFEQTGYKAVAQSHGVEIVKINLEERISVQIPEGEILKEIGIGRICKDSDTYFINVPKYKTHNLAVTTLSMKNLMGTITPHNERHLCGLSREFAARGHEITARGLTIREEHLDLKLCDLSLASKPDLNIIEGIVGRDGTAFHKGKNIQTDLVIAGKSTVSVDAVGTYLMGFDPKGVGYLRIAEERGLGIIDIEKIKVYEISNGKLMQCDDIDRFMSPIPFDVMASDGTIRDIPRNQYMLNRLQAAAVS